MSLHQNTISSPAPSPSRDGADDAPLLVSAKEARRLLGGMGNTKFYALVNAGHLETVLLGRSRMVRLASVQRLAKRGTA